LQELPDTAKRLSMSPRLSLKGVGSSPSPRLSIFAAQLADLRDAGRRRGGDAEGGGGCSSIGRGSSLDAVLEDDQCGQDAQRKLEAKLVPAFNRIEAMAGKQRKLDFFNREIARRARNFGEFVEEST